MPTGKSNKLRSVSIATTSAAETKAVGASVAAGLAGGEVLCLSGDLGAGKTTLVQGLGAALGIARSINSPTFVLLKQYEVKKKSSPVKRLVHVDCYRLKSVAEAAALGLAEYFNDPQTVVIIEWAEKIKKILPRQIVKISIQLKQETNRKITISYV